MSRLALSACAVLLATAACQPKEEGSPEPTAGKPATARTGGSGGSSASGGSGAGSGGSGGSSTPAATGGAGNVPATGGATGSTGGSPGTGGGGAGGGAAGAGGGAGGAPATNTDAAAPDTASGTPSTPGLKKIFDGTSWDGWEYDPRCWKLENGAMRGQCPSGQSQAFTKESYSNFRLILHSRMVASNDHLGVCIWGGRPRAGSYGFAGCLLPQPPGGAFWDYLTNKDHPTGGDKSKQSMWHKTEILANRMTGRVLMAVDGKLVHDFKDTQLPRRQNGPIGMQIHKATPTIVEYKDIEIEVDPKEDRLITLTQ